MKVRSKGCSTSVGVTWQRNWKIASSAPSRSACTSEVETACCRHDSISAIKACMVSSAPLTSSVWGTATKALIRSSHIAAFSFKASSMPSEMPSSSSCERMSHRWLVASFEMLKVLATTAPLASAWRHGGVQLEVGRMSQYPLFPVLPASTRPRISWKFSSAVGAAVSKVLNPLALYERYWLVAALRSW